MLRFHFNFSDVVLISGQCGAGVGTSNCIKLIHRTLTRLVIRTKGSGLNLRFADMENGNKNSLYVK